MESPGALEDIPLILFLRDIQAAAADEGVSIKPLDRFLSRVGVVLVRDPDQSPQQFRTLEEEAEDLLLLNQDDDFNEEDEDWSL